MDMENIALPPSPPRLQSSVSITQINQQNDDHINHPSNIPLMNNLRNKQTNTIHSFKSSKSSLQIIDKRLSLQAIIDPNNPQNKIRQEREAALYDYLNYVEIL